MPTEEEILKLQAENLALRRQLAEVQERLSAVEQRLTLLEQASHPEMDRMHREKLTSSMFNCAGYNPQERILELAFNSGEVYHYYDVPPEIYRDFLKAESKGQYFHSHIDDVFTYRQISRSKA